MTELLKIPRGLSEINKRYGNPDQDGDMILDPDFRLYNLSVFPLPFPMVASWNRGLILTRILAHIDVGPAMIDALEEILRTQGITKIRSERWDELGGVFNFRLKKGGSGLSTHAYGIAIDLCPRLGPFGDREAKFPREVSGPFVRRGFYQLPHDLQHLQAALGY